MFLHFNGGKWCIRFLFNYNFKKESRGSINQNILWRMLRCVSALPLAVLALCSWQQGSLSLASVNISFKLLIIFWVLQKGPQTNEARFPNSPFQKFNFHFTFKSQLLARVLHGFFSNLFWIVYTHRPTSKEPTFQNFIKNLLGLLLLPKFIIDSFKALFAKSKHVSP